MQFTAREISEVLKGTVDGDPSASVSGLAKIEEGKPGTLCFFANPAYEQYVYSTAASIVLVNKTFVPREKVRATLIRVEDAYRAFASLLQLYNERVADRNGVDERAFIDPSATVGANVYAGPFAHVGANARIGKGVKIYPQACIGDDVVIGDGTVVYQGVRIYHGCRIGAGCILHAGAVIGSDGFGFTVSEGRYKKIPQTGNVVIEDDVEVGANTTIDRATLGSTVIRTGVKLDNLIQIAHNVEIGEHTVIAAQTGIAGSTRIGKHCMIGGQVGIVGHLTIADGVKIAAQSGIGTSITTPNEVVQGSPAFSRADYKRVYVVFRKLPELEKKILELEKLLAERKPAAG